MYWLLSDTEQESVREVVNSLVSELSTINGPASQSDQLFPFVGRKDLRKARAVVSHLSAPDDIVVDPFSGSGIFAYAASTQGREIHANEWEPYTWRMSTAPWRLPSSTELNDSLSILLSDVQDSLNELYGSTCVCGNPIVIDSQFFDRVPKRFRNVRAHERLGTKGETITYRNKHKCKKCGRTEKTFDDADQAHLEEIESRKLEPWAEKIFSASLIENSRININKNFTIYRNFFPKRSMLALQILWGGVQKLSCSSYCKLFLEDAILAIIPQAKFKDYRSKSQDLHVPDDRLREVNLLYRFLDVVKTRYERLKKYSFSSTAGNSPIECEDFRDFLNAFDKRSVTLMFTDPPWTDGNAYFEKAQIYHPWLNYDLSTDSLRLENEVVVTDAPSRSKIHNLERWWNDMDEFFTLAGQKMKDLSYLAIYFRPIPAKKWLENLNKLKYEARKAGFEPLLTIDVSKNDPSMRIQQSASFAFADDLVFLLLRVPDDLRRFYLRDVDFDYLAFKAGSDLQEQLRAPFTRLEWHRKFVQLGQEHSVPEISLPKYSQSVNVLFNRYIREVSPGQYLVKPDTPFNGQLFDVPVEERLFSVVPHIVSDLTRDDASFTYDKFLLSLAQYVENGTRMLIHQVQSLDIKRMLAPYAEPLEEGKGFRKRSIPELGRTVEKLMDLDPYEFEAFTANLLENMGFTDVVQMGGSGDRGVDVIGTDSNGNRTVVQCKRYLNKVSADPIQRLHSYAMTRGADRKIVITTAGFTPQAKEEAENTKTMLVDGKKLEQLVQKYMPEFLTGTE